MFKRGLLAAVLVIAMPLGAPQGQEAEQAPANQRPAAPHEQAPAAPVQIPSVSSGVNIHSATNPTNNRQQQENWVDKAWRHWGRRLFSDLKITDLLLAIFTFFLAVYTARLWAATEKLWESSETHGTHLQESVEAARNNAIAAARQAETAALQHAALQEQATATASVAAAAVKSAEIAERALDASERAWVSVDVTIAGPLTYNSDGGAVIPLLFTMRNHGKSPAMFVWPHAKVVFRPNDCLIAQSEIIAEIENGNASRSNFGYTVFPQNRVQSNVTFSELGRDIAKAQAGGGRAMLMPWITGLVDYRVPGSEGHRQTCFIYFIRRKRAEEPLNTAIFPDEGDVPVAELQIFPWFIEPRGFRAT
jgi:hypothetical protein